MLNTTKREFLEQEAKQSNIGVKDSCMSMLIAVLQESGQFVDLQSDYHIMKETLSSIDRLLKAKDNVADVLNILRDSIGDKTPIRVR